MEPWYDVQPKATELDLHKLADGDIVEIHDAGQYQQAYLLECTAFHRSTKDGMFVEGLFKGSNDEALLSSMEEEYERDEVPIYHFCLGPHRCAVNDVPNRLGGAGTRSSVPL